MDSSTPCLDFAVVGHQDSWKNIAAFVNSLRNKSQGDLSLEKIKNIFPFIPARDLFRVKVNSKTGASINGVYIDTFIDPDKLNTSYLLSNIKKVHDGIACAKKMGAKVVALGGFTSIVLEGNLDSFSTKNSKFTTGNTLTSAFIVKSIEKAAFQKNVDLKLSSVLIVGATGDIGMACVQYLKNRTHKLLLCARNEKQLKKLSDQLDDENIENDYSITLGDLIPKADIIICVASSNITEISNCKENVIISDAGYPKNLDSKVENNFDLIFHGGMGQVNFGFEFYPDYTDSFYQYPAPNIIHGCILEAMILAFENKYEDYSIGKGNISIDKIEEIYELGLKHGITVAPFYNSKGLIIN